MFEDSKYKLGDIVMYNGNRYRVTTVRRITKSIPYTLFDYEYDLKLIREPREGELSVIRGVREYAIGDPDTYEDQKKGKELLRLSKQCIKYDRERPEFLPEYRNIPVELEQSLNKVHDDMINSLLYSVPTFYMKKEEVNAMFGVPKFEYKKIIFNGPCTIILWKDGTKTIAKASDGEMFDPEKGVAICFMKRALGETEGKKVLRKANKDYYDEVSRIANKQLDEELKKATFPLPKGVTFRPFTFDTPIDNNKVIKVEKVEENHKMDFRSCSTCKYASKPVTDKPCSNCASKSRYERGDK